MNSNIFELNNYYFVDFDFNIDSVLYCFNNIKKRKGYRITFRCIEDDSLSYGHGANKYVYQKIAMNLLDAVESNEIDLPLIDDGTEFTNHESILIRKHNYFVEPNLCNNFWKDPENIYAFVVFIASMISFESVLPYHLSPAILEFITYKKLTESELKFYLEKIDPELQGIDTIDDNFIKELGLGFDTVMDYLRFKVVGTLTSEQIVVYEEIASNFSLFNSFADFDIPNIDSVLSGKYTITADDVLKITIIEKKYINLWKKFVRSLSESELKQMLLSFGNTLSLDNHYNIHVNTIQTHDINIMTCAKDISIRENMLTEDEMIEQLRIYFRNNDSMRDDTYVEQDNNDSMNNIVPELVDNYRYDGDSMGTVSTMLDMTGDLPRRARYLEVDLPPVSGYSTYRRRLGFRPENGDNQWSRNDQNSGMERRRRPMNISPRNSPDIDNVTNIVQQAPRMMFQFHNSRQGGLQYYNTILDNNNNDSSALFVHSYGFLFDRLFSIQTNSDFWYIHMNRPVYRIHNRRSPRKIITNSNKLLIEQNYSQ
jgi:hypothetical protein